MIQQAIDFRDESDALFALLEPLDDRDWERKTQFKDWTINDVLAHLHFGNYLADLSLKDADAFTALMRNNAAARKPGASHLSITHAWLDGIRHRALLDRWRDFYRETAEHFAVADPKQRVRWVGPDMSVRSSITARLMETWAHGQAIYDQLGVVRSDADRIKNIAVLGINTFGWTFTNRGLEVPVQRPSVRLTAPSSAQWEWPQPDQTDLIEGRAVEFCQVVAQTCNLADTKLRVVGEIANRWMAIAQCFAGPPENPPLPGTRFRQSG
ncbi:MAG: TIGR03084 family metal-binding protein [Candidatus Binataceae bacterium]